MWINLNHWWGMLCEFELSTVVWVAIAWRHSAFCHLQVRPMLSLYTPLCNLRQTSSSREKATCWCELSWVAFTYDSCKNSWISWTNLGGKSRHGCWHLPPVQSLHCRYIPYLSDLCSAMCMPYMSQSQAGRSPQGPQGHSLLWLAQLSFWLSSRTLVFFGSKTRMTKAKPEQPSSWSVCENCYQCAGFGKDPQENRKQWMGGYSWYPLHPLAISFFSVSFGLIITALWRFPSETCR